MSFISQEQGIESSNVVELYKFTGSIRNFYYTSSNTPVLFEGQDYIPTSMECSDLALSDVTEKNELKITMPTSDPLIKMYGLDIPPPSLTLDIYRRQVDTEEFATWLNGVVTDIAVEGKTSTLTVPSNISVALSSDFPNAIYQGPCGRTLYDSRCTVQRTSFQVLGTVELVQDQFTIFVQAMAAKPDQWAKGGEIKTSGERRLIKDQIGAQLTFAYPFRSIAQGDAVVVQAGCSRSAFTCQEKFSNLVNFFGFPYTPSLNPFLKQPEDYGKSDGSGSDVSDSGGGAPYVAPLELSAFPPNLTSYTMPIGTLTDLPIAGRVLTVLADGTVTNNPASYVTPAGSTRWVEVNTLTQTRLAKAKGQGIPWPLGATLYSSPDTSGIWTPIPSATDLRAAGGGIVAIVQDDGSFVRTARVQTRT